jgi:hypothetical protein
MILLRLGTDLTGLPPHLSNSKPLIEMFREQLLYTLISLIITGALAGALIYKIFPPKA